MLGTSRGSQNSTCTLGTSAGHWCCYGLDARTYQTRGKPYVSEAQPVPPPATIQGDEPEVLSAAPGPAASTAAGSFLGTKMLKLHPEFLSRGSGAAGHWLVRTERTAWEPGKG